MRALLRARVRERRRLAEHRRDELRELVLGERRLRENVAAEEDAALVEQLVLLDPLALELPRLPVGARRAADAARRAARDTSRCRTPAVDAALRRVLLLLPHGGGDDRPWERKERGRDWCEWSLSRLR